MAPRQPGTKRTNRRAGLGAAVLVLLASLLAVRPGLAQAANADVTYTRQMIFRIPFEPVSGSRQPQQVTLHYSLDQGRSWRSYGSVPFQRLGFDFRAEQDGTYWFTIQTVDADGRVYPTVIDGARPGLKVCVDTKPPAVALRPLAPRDGMIGLEWEVRDDNLDVASLRLDYKFPGSGAWMPLSVEPAATGQRYWNPATNGPVEARLTVYDRAGNLGEGTTTLNTNGATGLPTATTPDPRGGASAAPVAPPPAGPRMVNSKRINLNYEIKEAGPSGVSAVQLWFTQDGRSWKMYVEDKDPHPPFAFDVAGEGLYGFTLVVRSGVGLGERPPQTGDPPQVWVEVDLTKPVVRLAPVVVGRNEDKGKLYISWTASDKNLRDQPITLTYAEKPEGPWNPIAANLDNGGRYVWNMPANVPYQFYVRCEAADKAGNIGSDQSPELVKVDLAVPKAAVIGVEPTPAK